MLSIIPLGFFKQSPFNGCFPSAQKHLFFLSFESTAQDVYGMSRQSESVLHSLTALLTEKIISENKNYFHNLYFVSIIIGTNAINIKLYTLYT